MVCAYRAQPSSHRFPLPGRHRRHPGWPSPGRLSAWVVLCLMAALGAQLAQAVPSFDPFVDATGSGGTSYTVGDDLTNQFTATIYAPWYVRGGNFGTTQPVIAAGNLSYPGLPASTGNSVSFSPASAISACLDLNLPAGHGQLVYSSFLLKLTDLSNVPTYPTNNPFAAFADDPTRPSFAGNQIGRLGGRVVTKKVGSGFVLGISSANATSASVYEPDGNAHNVGDVLFVVQGVQLVSGVMTNEYLWINPSSSSFGSSSAPAPSLTAPYGTAGGLNGNGPRVFALLCQYLSAPSGVIDDLRVATNWATVTAAPDIYSQPLAQTTNAGSPVTFTVAAFGGTPLSYQWQKDGGNLSDGGNISGASSATLTLSSVLASDMGNYTVVVANSYGQVTSAPAYLSVNDPYITVQPTNQMVNIGATATLQVGVVGTPTLSYQWYTNGVPLSDSGDLSGSTTATLTIHNFSSADAATYSVWVYNGLGSSIQSSNAVLSLTDPSIAVQPQSMTNVYGTTATFEVTASGTAPFSYQWHRANVGDLSDGGNVSGSQSSALSLSGVSYLDSGTYSVTVSNALGTVDSVPVELTVLDPAITTDPASVSTAAGNTATFHVVAVGTAALSFQWQKNGSFIFDTGNYSGTSTDTLTVSGVSAADQGSYSVVVVGGSGNTATSANATLTVLSPVAITAQPTARKVLAGTRTALAVGVSGDLPQFQWQLEGADVPGATAAAYVLNDVEPGVTGNYRVIVSNGFSSQTSSVAPVSIVGSLHLYPTNVVAIRVGNGAEALTTSGNSMFLDQFGPDGSYLSSQSIPDDGPSALVAIGPTTTTSPSSTTGNSLSHSANGRFLVIGGYNTNLSFPSELQSTGAGALARGIGLIDDQAQYTLAISSKSASSGNFFRGGCTDGTNNYWSFARTFSTYYYGYDQPGQLIQSVWSNLRSMAIFNGQLYVVSPVAGQTGVARFVGLPTAPETVQVVINTGSSGASDCEVSPDGSLIYVADSRAGANGGGIQRWQFDGSTWSLAYTLNDQLSHGAYYVTADFSGPNPVVYAVTTDATNNQIVQFSDTGFGATGSVVAYAGANQNFRGIRLGPAATTNTTQPVLSETPGAGALTLNWNGSFFLQSATNVSGPYQDVINGTRPYTNSTAGGQGFFRLRQ